VTEVTGNGDGKYGDAGRVLSDALDFVRRLPGCNSAGNFRCRLRYVHGVILRSARVNLGRLAGEKRLAGRARG
jgi:hypothetical protein